MNNQPRPVVIDNGTANSKVGFAGKIDPQSIFPTIHGKKYMNHCVCQCENVCADQALFTQYTYPIQRGQIKNWEQIEVIWQYTFDKILRVSSQKQPCLFAESINNSRQAREKIAEIFFEKFNVPSFCLINQQLLSLYSSGKITGLIVESGEGVTNIVPYINGLQDKKAKVSLELGGIDLTEQLRHSLQDLGYSINRFSSRDMSLIRQMKESVSFIQQSSKQQDINTTYCLPDGSFFTIGKERHKCVEPLFKSSFIKSSQPSIRESIQLSIQNLYDSHFTNLIQENIVITGGNTKCDGFYDRLVSELGKSLDFGSFSVTEHIKKDCSAWVGGSILGSTNEFNWWIKQVDYFEKGYQVIYDN